MKTCMYCKNQYDELEYSYKDDFCCLFHYVRVNRLTFEKYKEEVNKMTPQIVYLELCRGFGELNVEKTELYLSAMSEDENTIKLLLSNKCILSKFYLDEYVCMIKKFPTQYTLNILEILQTQYINGSIIRRLTNILSFISEDKREIIQAFIIACKLGDDNK